MPLHPHIFGAVVADVTAHPSMDVGVAVFVDTGEGWTARDAAMTSGTGVAVEC